MDSGNDPLPTRFSLLERAMSRGDSATWEELIGYYEPFIRKILLRMNFRGADLDDARQQVVLKLWKGLETFRRQESGARFRNWLSTLIRNAAIDWLKKNRPHTTQVELTPAEAEVMVPDASELECLIEEEWQRHLISCAMENLRGVFTGRAFEVLALALQGQEAEEIAEEIGIRKESVYVLKARVKKRLQQEIQRLRNDLEGSGP